MSAPWKTVRIFISSTFKDMQAERDHLVRFVFPKLREELMPSRIHLIDVDLRWGVTSDQDALGVCREVIDECHPRFMGILGGRYGWVPPDRTDSITADEVHYGVLKREAENRGDAFFYFRDPLATSEMAEEKPGEFRELEGSDNERSLADLKRSVTDAGLPVFIYPAHWDAAQKRLTGLEVLGNKVRTDLFESLKNDKKLADHFTEQSTGTFDEFQEEADQMDAFIEERTDRFILGSRETLMRDMLAFAAAEDTPNIFVLTGAPGSGKSAFLAKFYRSLAEGAPHLQVSPSPSLLLAPHFIGASTGSTDLRRTLRRLCHELASPAGNTEPLPLDIKELITHFQKLLAEAAGRRRVILVFDALNQFDATDGAHWMNWLPRELPPGVRIFASVIAPAGGEKEHQTLAILKNRKDVRVEELKPLDETDTLAIIEGYLKRYSKRLDSKQIAALKEKPPSNLPLYVLTALEELRTLGTYEEITDRIRTLPGDARALFGWILTERLARDPGFRDREGRPCGAALVEKFASCLGISRHGLSPSELTALLDPGDPLGNVAALLRLLRPYLMRRGELLDFYHGQFREAAETAHLDTSGKQRAAHQSVATCLQAFADPHRDGQCRDATPHALSELPHHQTRAEAWPDLIASLENIFFLEAKVTHGMAFDLVEDFTAAVDALPPEHIERPRIRLLDEALRRDIHFIARHAVDYPQGLFQCLWNSAWWYDCPDAALHYSLPKGELMYSVPWESPDAIPKLCAVLRHWRKEREFAFPGFSWLRSLRPPSFPLGAGQLAVMRGHEDGVCGVAFSPDGRHVLSGAKDKTLRLWEIQTGRELAVLHGHQDSVSSVAYSPDGSQVLSGSWDRTLRLWDPKDGRELAVLRGHQDSVSSVAYSPDGSRVLSGSVDKTLRLWDAKSGRELAVLRGHQAPVNAVAFSPDGNIAVSGSGHWKDASDNTVCVWRLDRNDNPILLHGHKIIVSCVAYSPDGLHLVSGSYDQTLRFWDTTSQCEVGILGSVERLVLSVAFSKDGQRIASGSSEGTVRIWNATVGGRYPTLREHWKGGSSTWFSPNGHRFVTGSIGRTSIWNTDNGCLIKTLISRDVLSLLKEKRWDTQEGQPFVLESEFEKAAMAEVGGVGHAPTFICAAGGGETTIYNNVKSRPLGHFSERLEDVRSHKPACIIAGFSCAINSHFVLLRFEGSGE